LTNNQSGITEGYAVELYLNEEAEASVLAFRDLIYGGGVQPVQGLMNDKPHVSLAVFPRINETKLLEVTEKFAEGLSSFPFRLGAVGTFPTPDNVLFLYPVPTPELLEAHASFHAALTLAGLESSRYYFPNLWVPHLTLEFNLLKGDVCKSVGIFQENFQPINGIFTQLGVVGFRPIEYLASFDITKGNK
jgi:2'-5' RNA ligase